MIEAVVGTPPACLAPTNLTFSNPTSTSVTVNFTASTSSPTGYRISYSPAGSATQPILTTATSANITGLMAGTTYTFSVVADCSANASPPATAPFTTVPANDQCNGAIAVACGSSVAGTTKGSTGANAPAGSVAGAGGVYYRFVGTGERITANLCGSTAAFDSYLLVYSGSCGGLAPVASNNDACGAGGLSAVTFLSVPGTVYYLYVSGFTAASRGDFTLTLSCSPADLLVSTATAIGGPYRNVTITSTGAATLADDLTVNGTLTVQVGGALTGSALYHVQGPGSLVLAAGSSYTEPNPAGLTNDGSATFHLTGTGSALSLSTDASYIFQADGPQATGPLLPATVRSLTVNGTAATAANRNLTLTGPLAVRQQLRLQAGNLTTNGQPLTLLSARGQGTALIDNTGGSVIGNGTMQRAIDAVTDDNIGYHHFSSPVANTTVGDLANGNFAPGSSFVTNSAYNLAALAGQVRPFPTVFGYDEARLTSSPATDLGTFDKGFFVPGSTDPWPVGHGYTANMANASVPDFVGTFNTGNVTIGGLTRGAGPDAGWQLLGNPYPSPFDWSTVTAAQLTNLEATMYQFHATSRYTGTYTSYLTNGISNTGTGSQAIIDAGAGFFARVTTAGQPAALHLTNANRITTYGTQPSFGRAATGRPLLVLQVHGATDATDAIAVYTDALATTGVDYALDAPKLANSNGLNLAALAGNTALAINALPALIAATTVVPLRLGVPATGNFTFTLTSFVNFGAVQVWLRDAQAGIEQPLRAGGIYSFAVTNATQPTTRFSLVLRPSSVTATEVSFRDVQVSLYPNPAHNSFSLLLPPIA